MSCSTGPSRITPPSINADGAAARAIELFDANHDGLIGGKELDSCPSLKASMATLDSNQDGSVAESEIADRIRSWQASRAGLSSILCYVTMDGQPLADAEVTFQPAEFLVDVIEPAVGKSNIYGVASPSIPKEKRPSPDMPPGLRLGFYNVIVSKLENGKETIPARYNTATTLGQQVANDDPAILKHRVELNLTH
jgi:hypothetical protein